MPRTAQLIDVMISGPSDVAEEIEAIFDVISDLNRVQNNKRSQVLFVGRYWKNDSVGQVSDDAQTSINEQLLDSFDVLIGIFGDTLGTETARAASGTVEEIEIALGKDGSLFDNQHLQVFFRDAVRGKKADLDFKEIARVEEFKKEIQQKVITSDFDTTETLKRKVSLALNSALNRYESKWSALVAVESVGSNVELEKSNDVDSSDDGEPEFLDCVIGMKEDFEQSGFYMVEMGDAIGVRTEEMRQFGAKLEAANSRGDVSEAKRIYDNIGDALGNFTETVLEPGSKSIEFLDQGSEKFESLLLSSEFDELRKDEPEYNSLKEQISDTVTAIEEFRVQLEGTVESINDLPRFTSKFRNGRKRFSTGVQEIANRFRSSEGRLKEYLNFLEA